jgi:hypothetical protein
MKTFEAMSISTLAAMGLLRKRICKYLFLNSFLDQVCNAFAMRAFATRIVTDGAR